jgi:hypothetical protein
VKGLFEIIQREEVNKILTSSMENLLSTIANRAHKGKFPEIVY